MFLRATLKKNLVIPHRLVKEGEEGIFSSPETDNGFQLGHLAITVTDCPKPHGSVWVSFLTLSDKSPIVLGNLPSLGYSSLLLLYPERRPWGSGKFST